MTVVLILLTIFLGVGAMVALMNLSSTYSTTRVLEAERALAKARAQAQAAALPPPTDPHAAPVLALQLPPAQRGQVWDILCRIQDAGTPPDPRAAYTLQAAASDYLPETLRAYLQLSDPARQRLQRQGMNPETLLSEQLQLIADGVAEALGHDHAAADRLLAQGQFLRGRFTQGAEEPLRSLHTPSPAQNRS
ncbi:MAG: hypothetical protein Q4C67_05770 [Deinococcus sp.]|nr:hypothetical protein [Deinococcus sp.]